MQMALLFEGRRVVSTGGAATMGATTENTGEGVGLGGGLVAGAGDGAGMLSACTGNWDR